MAEEYADIAAEKKVILGSITNPYVDNEVLDRAQTVESVRRYKPLGYGAIEIHYSSNGKQYVSSSVRARPEEVPTILALYNDAGYQVYSMEFDACGNEKAIFKDLEQFNEVRSSQMLIQSAVPDQNAFRSSKLHWLFRDPAFDSWFF